jgi:hypothetical protein
MIMVYGSLHAVFSKIALAYQNMGLRNKTTKALLHNSELQ